MGSAVAWVKAEHFNTTKNPFKGVQFKARQSATSNEDIYADKHELVPSSSLVIS